ncbi:MAG: class I SAM-dependent methyltransferase [Phycisphaerae bacterium]|nr:class I SAM-dependent methyltransferase [Phycisphaerae bacterium]
MGFDQYALNYEAELCRGLRWSGQQPDWFAERRVACVRQHCHESGLAPRQVLEFGCGVGIHVPFLRAAFPESQIIGLDISRESLAVAARRHGSHHVCFSTPEEFSQRHTADLAYVNGVFHHIAPAEHRHWLHRIRDYMAPGALLAMFDNNPFSLPARWVMHSIPFDQNAIMVNPHRFARLMRATGFGRPRLRFHFLFPRALSCLHGIESLVARLPLAAQFSLLACRKE